MESASVYKAFSSTRNILTEIKTLKKSGIKNFTRTRK